MLASDIDVSMPREAPIGGEVSRDLSKSGGMSTMCMEAFK